MRRADLLRYWVPALIWSAVLLFLSGQSGSSGISAGILGWFLPATSPIFDEAHFIVRKLLHVLAYGLLGFLDFRAVRGSRGGWTVRWSAIAVVLAVAIASLDEWHQSYVPGRTGVPGDVAIDAMGATLAQALWRAAVPAAVDGRPVRRPE